MKTPTKGVLLLVALALVVAVSLPVFRFFASSRDSIRDYGEAEPLVNVIWPMANEMKRFSDERGHSPSSLDEITRFSPTHDFSALRRYEHQFSTNGPRRFFLRVNRRFAFVIDEHYTPTWWQPTPVMSAPTNPK